MQQVQSHQSDLAAAIKEQNAKLAGGADETPCTLAHLLAWHNGLVAAHNELEDTYHQRFCRLEEDVFNDEELEAIANAEANAKNPEDSFEDWPERQPLQERLTALDHRQSES